MIIGKYPNLRLRRTRKHSWSRRLVQENSLSCNDLIYPIFLTEGKNKVKSIKSMPNIYKFSIDKLGDIVDKVIKNRIPMVALFPNIENNKNINLKKSSDESAEPMITSDPPSHSSKTAIDTPIVSIIGEEVKRNFAERNNNPKYFQDSLLNRSISWASIANAFTILIEVRFSVIMLNIPPICFVFRLALRLMLFPMY